jgi:hypothetical protein
VREVSHPSERRLQHGGADAGDVHAHARCVCFKRGERYDVILRHKAVITYYALRCVKSAL